MFTAISIFILLVCIILSLVVLVQDSKGGGLTAGLSSSSQIMGVRKTTDMLEKLTWGFAIALFVLSFMGSILLPEKGESQVGLQNSFMQEQIQNAQNPGSAVFQTNRSSPAEGQQGGQPQSAPPPAGN